MSPKIPAKMKIAALLAAAALTLAATPSWALPSMNPADYDVPAAQTYLSQVEAQASQVRSQFGAADQRVRQEQQQLEQAQRILQDLKTKLSQANAQVSESQGRIQSLRAELSQAQSQQSAIQGQLPGLRAQAQTAATERERAIQAARQADAEADLLEAKAKQDPSLLPAARQARLRANQLRGEASRADSIAQQARQALQSAETNLSQVSSRIPALQQALSQEGQRLESAQRQAQQASSQIPSAQFAVDRQSDELSRAVAQREQLRPAYEQAEQSVRLARGRLDQVRRNVEIGVAEASEDGRREGVLDGYREGTEVGARRGAIEGADRGAFEGEQAGTLEAITRARRAGQESGERVGYREGSDAGSVQGSVKGREDGAARGRSDGLAAGYEAGRREGDAAGYPEGAKAGHAAGGFAKGRAEGYSAGSQRASTEATAKGQGDGYRETEQSYLDAPLKEVTLSTAGDSRPFDHQGDWRGMNPRHGYPHPLLREAYERAYRQAYQQEAARAYELAYQQTFRQAYDQRYQYAYQQAVMRPYPGEYQASYDRAYRQSYDSAFRRSYDTSYRVAYEPAQREAYQAALPIRREEGYRDGRAAGFERGRTEAYAEDFGRGRSEGDVAGYQETYPRVYAQAKAAGNRRADEYYTQNAVLKFDGATFVDANDDGITAPGELVRVTLRLRNFGKAAESAGRINVALTSVGEGLQPVSSAATLPALPGQAQVQVSGLLPVRLLPVIALGKAISSDFVLNRRSETLGSGSLTVTPAYPYSILRIGAPSVVLPDQPQTLAVEVRNVSTKSSTQDIRVHLVSLDQLAQPTGGDFALGKLSPTQQKQAGMVFQFPEASVFQKLKFEVQIFEGETLVGKRRAEVDATRRWVYHPESTALLVVSGNAAAKKAERAAAAAGLASDLFDLRVEGELTPEVIGHYLAAGKLLVLPSLDSSFGPQSAQAITALLNQGGAVYADTGAGLQGNPVGEVLNDYATRYARPAFGGLGRVGQGNEFASADQRALVILGAGGSANETPAALAARLQAAQLLALPIDGKVNLFRSLVTAGKTGTELEQARDSILRDLSQEMQDDKAIDGKNYKKNVQALHLTRFIDLALSAQGAERRELVKLYPALNDARKDIGWLLSARRLAIKSVLKPLKKAFGQEIED